MQEHPVPQNVTSFEFKLIGDMTLRQFGYVGSGFALALIAYFLPVTDKILVYIIKFPLIFIPPIVGFALAFLPIEGRPLDRWLVSFFRAVFGNTMYVWKKEGVNLEVLHNLPNYDQGPQVITAAPNSTGPRTVNLQPGYVKAPLPRPMPLSPLDRQEEQALHRLQHTMPHQPVPSPSQLAGTRPVIRPDRPIPQPSPHQKPRPFQPQITSFAGAPKPSYTLAATYQEPIVQARPTVMREPFQKPLVPKKIPLPAYQAATLPQEQKQLESLWSSPAPITGPKPIHHDTVVPVQQKPIVGSDRPMLPGEAARLAYMGQLQPAAPAPQPPVLKPEPTNNNEEIKKQNQALLEKLKQLEQAVAAPQPQAGLPTADHNKDLQMQLQSLENALNQVRNNVLSLAGEEEKYQQILLDATSKLKAVTKEKQAVQAALAQQQREENTSLNALAKAQEEKTDLEQRLKALQGELGNTKTLYDQLLKQKQAAEQTIAQAPIPVQIVPASVKTSAQQAATLGTQPAAPERKPKEQAFLPVSPGAQTEPVKVTIVPPDQSDLAQHKPAKLEQKPAPEMPTLSELEAQALAFQFPKPSAKPKTPKSTLPLHPPTRPEEKHDATLPPVVFDKPLPSAAFQRMDIAASTTIPNAMAGFVFDEQGKPLMDVIVVVKKAGGPTMRALKTNRVGQFSMVSPLPDGNYEINFESDTHEFAIMNVEAKGQIIPPLRVQGKAIG